MSSQLGKRLYSKLTRTSITLSSNIPHKRYTATLKRHAKVDKLASKYVMNDPFISIARDGRMFLVVTFKVPNIHVLDENDAIGIDLGVRHLVTTSEGVAYSNADYLANRCKIRYNKRKL